ncbi:hypothetical protein AV530_005122 [Patagioenas fasciata monilis]|uniref:Uncharacterized protein n=1 Tax=Patagioenas fasciata monilis TaxID=372326 RepID=A0A1V4K443_PATFA|nr:hypothetical protein AV530_005122 [Patagioenas fasciata monilis]
MKLLKRREPWGVGGGLSVAVSSWCGGGALLVAHGPRLAAPSAAVRAWSSCRQEKNGTGIPELKLRYHRAELIIRF